MCVCMCGAYMYESGQAYGNECDRVVCAMVEIIKMPAIIWQTILKVCEKEKFNGVKLK